MLGNNLLAQSAQTEVVASSYPRSLSDGERAMHDAARPGRGALPPGDRHIGSILNRGQVATQEDLDAARHAKEADRTRRYRALACCAIVCVLFAVSGSAFAPEIAVPPGGLADWSGEWSAHAGFVYRGSTPITGVWQFAGIKYGTAERWQLPVKAGLPFDSGSLSRKSPWVVDATEFGSTCTQPNLMQLAGRWWYPLLFLAVGLALWWRYLPVPLALLAWLAGHLRKQATDGLALAGLGQLAGQGDAREFELAEPGATPDGSAAAAVPAAPTPRWSNPPTSKRTRRAAKGGVCVSFLLALVAAFVAGFVVTAESFAGSEDCLFLNVLRQDFVPEADGHGGAISTHFLRILVYSGLTWSVFVLILS